MRDAPAGGCGAVAEVPAIALEAEERARGGAVEGNDVDGVDDPIVAGGGNERLVGRDDDAQPIDADARSVARPQDRGIRAGALVSVLHHLAECGRAVTEVP